MSTALPAKPGYREFTCVRDDKSTILLSVRKPTRKEREYADLEYSATFNRVICKGIPTQTALLRNLRENGIINKETEDKISQLATERVAKEKEMARDKFESPEAKKAAQEKLDELTNKLMELNGEIDSYFDHTAETKSSQAQRNFLIACVIEVQQEGDRKGKRQWPSVEDLLAEDDGALINRTIYEYMMCQSDKPSEWDKLIAQQASDAAEDKKEEKKEETADASKQETPENKAA